jgi:hypothetical protein
VILMVVGGFGLLLGLFLLMRSDQTAGGCVPPPV